MSEYYGIKYKLFPFDKNEEEFFFRGLRDETPLINIGLDYPEYEKPYIVGSDILSENIFRKRKIYNFDNNFAEQNKDIDIYQPCIVDSFGEVIKEDKPPSKIIVTEINDQLLCTLSKNPDLLYGLSSYNFECVIARIFEKMDIR